MQKAGGIAALIEAVAYVVGFAVLLTVLNPGDAEDWSAVQRLQFALENKDLIQVWMSFIYVVFGLALVVLAVALHERLKPGATGLMQVASAFGLIWAGLVIASGMIAVVGLDAAATLAGRDLAQAAGLWTAISAIQRGLGGGVEIVGGLWMLLVGVSALRTKALPRSLAYAGLAVGAAGVATLVPGLGELGTVFGLGQIVWFAWIGGVLLRQPRAAAPA
jgi:hypothetical protein